MKRAALVTLLLFAVVGAFAPVIANEVPVVASVHGELRFPAVAELFGQRSAGPEGRRWKDWFADLPLDSEDWALLPFIPYGPHETHRDLGNAGPQVFSHYLGNDDTGRDVLSRLIHGTRTAVVIGLGSALLALLIGVPLGLLAGYRGGGVDLALTALVQLFLCFPPIFFVLAITTFVGSSVAAVVLVLGLLYWVGFARIVRGEVLVVREREFVACARGLGIPPWRIMFRHILPAIRGPILVNTAFVVASAVIVESTLSFLQLGPGSESVSWGTVLMQGKEYAEDGKWHLWLFPSVVLVTLVTALHSLADERSRSGAVSAGS